MTDLDALERELTEDLSRWAESQSWAANYGRILIKRLRKAERGWEATAASRNLAFRAIESAEERIAQLEQELREAEAENKRMRFTDADDYLEALDQQQDWDFRQRQQLESRIAQLERVREAASYVLANLDADDLDASIWGPELRAALAAVEEKSEIGKAPAE